MDESDTELAEMQRKLDVLVAETTDERDYRLEVLGTVLLGLAAIAIAWSAFQSSLWGGAQDTALTSSINTTTESVDLLQEADSIRSLDLTLFIELFTSGACDEAGDEFVCDQIEANLSEAGAAAVDVWFENDAAVPFDDEVYIDALYGEGRAAADEAAVFFEEAAEANGNGDDYELASTLLTVALFFAGISIVLKGERLRIGLLGTGFVLFAGSTVYLLTLPLA